MAFRLSDFGIPSFDTNVDYLYKHAVEHGESIPCGEEEFVVYRMQDTPFMVVLRFAFEADGETPRAVTAHTFLDNPVRWQEGVKASGGGRALVMLGGAWIAAELINEGAGGAAFMPMLYADAIRFGQTRLAVGADMLMPEGELAPDLGGGVQALARVRSVKPVVVGKLWLFSVVELALGEGSLFVPVSRDVMEPRIHDCSEGALCYINGSLSLMADWA